MYANKGTKQNVAGVFADAEVSVAYKAGTGMRGPLWKRNVAGLARVNENKEEGKGSVQRAEREG